MDLTHIWQYIQTNWLLVSFAIVGGLNIIIAGARVLGLTRLADECLKIEDAIKAMIDAAKLQIKKKQGMTVTEVILIVVIFACFGGAFWYGLAKKTNSSQFQTGSKQVNNYHMTKNYALLDFLFIPFEIHGCTRETPESTQEMNEVLNDVSTNDIVSTDKQ